MSRASNQELGPGGCRCRCRCRCRCGGWDGGGSVYLSILEGTCTVLYCTYRSVESEHLFLAGKLFSLLFFFLDRVGELAAAAEEEKCFGSFYIFLEEGAFLVLLLLLGSTWLSSSLSLFLSRSGEFGRGSGREEREERKAV